MKIWRQKLIVGWIIVKHNAKVNDKKEACHNTIKTKNKLQPSFITSQSQQKQWDAQLVRCVDLQRRLSVKKFVITMKKPTSAFVVDLVCRTNTRMMVMSLAFASKSKSLSILWLPSRERISLMRFNCCFPAMSAACTRHTWALRRQPTRRCPSSSSWFNDTILRRSFKRLPTSPVCPMKHFQKCWSSFTLTLVSTWFVKLIHPNRQCSSILPLSFRRCV